MLETFLNILKNHYFDFKGRARRTDFWTFFFAIVIINVVFTVLATILRIGIIALIGNLATLALLLPYLGVAVRRMQDVGKPWWFILIPLYNLYLWAQDSEPGANEYGENPKGIS